MITRQTVTYVCQFCDSEHLYPSQALSCEGSHLGLNLRDYKRYRELLESERDAARTLSRTNNEETRKKFDDAANATLKFINDRGIAENVERLKGICIM